MYKTFDAWDKLQAPLDLDSGSVGRDIVADACILRATADLGTKIRKSDQINSLERWLRQDLTRNQHEGNVFFRKKVETASLILGQFREGNFNLFGFYPRSKNTKVWQTIVMRLMFLRSLTATVAATKDIEILILELLLRANAVDGEKPLALTTFDEYLQELEILAMWMALSGSSASQRLMKCFTYLEIIRHGKSGIHSISQEEKLSLREALIVTELGSNASGKKFVIALLKRLNDYILAQNKNENDVSDTSPMYLEPILPLNTSAKVWNESFPDSKERVQWVHRIGNLVLISKKATVREGRMPFSEKKLRFQKERWPLTLDVSSLDDWNSDNLVKQLAKILSLIEEIWSL